MSALMAIGVAAFLAALVLLLFAAASLLAALAFRFLPKLQGTFLSLTASDVVRAIRQMPTYPAWWHRFGVPARRPILVLLARNPMTKEAAYVSGINRHLHTLDFTSHREMAHRFDSCDRLALRTYLQKAEDERKELFLVLAETVVGRVSVPGEAGRVPRFSTFMRTPASPIQKPRRTIRRPVPGLAAKAKHAR